MEACSSTTSTQKPRQKRKPDGTRLLRSEIEIVNKNLRDIHTPLVDLKPIRNEGKFLGRHRLYIGNISSHATKEDLENAFKVFGDVSDVFMQQNKNFGFVRMDYYHNALKAKQQLQGTILRDRKINITFSPQASITVKHLSPTVSNELLHVAFSVFGEVEYCFIIPDKRGKSSGKGVVDFVNKRSALAAKKFCNDYYFFITSSLKPIAVEDYVPPRDMDGISEEKVRKSHDFYEEREFGPRFALPGSFEYSYAQRYKELWDKYEVKLSRLKAELESEECKLQMDLMRARYDNETERLREMIRQRELEKERFCQKLEKKARYETCIMDEVTKIEFKRPDLFHQPSQLNNILEDEESEMQEQWRISEYRSEYDLSSYQRLYEQSCERVRKLPEVIIHTQRKTRFAK